MRKSSLLLLLILVLAALLAAAAAHATRRRHGDGAEIEARARLVRELALTDLCLFTEARYTRHPTQTDLFAPFQDHPLSLEHFPSGSLLGPPASMRERYAQPD